MARRRDAPSICVRRQVVRVRPPKVGDGGNVWVSLLPHRGGGARRVQTATVPKILVARRVDAARVEDEVLLKLV